MKYRRIILATVFAGLVILVALVAFVWLVPGGGALNRGGGNAAASDFTERDEARLSRLQDSSNDSAEAAPSPRLAPPVSQNRIHAKDSPQLGATSIAERHYPEAERLRVVERNLADGGRERVTLLRTDLKYPLVRVVDRLGAVDASGVRPVLQSVAMAAGHLLVNPKSSMSDAELSARLLGEGWQPRAVLPQSGHWLVALPTEKVAGAQDRFSELLTDLANNVGDLAGVEADFLFYPSGLADDASFVDGSLWGLRNEGQLGGTAGADIGAVEAWDIRNDASGVIVAVVDTGLRMTHEDIAANLWTNMGEIPGNGVDDDGNGVIDDVHGFDAIDGGGDPTDEDGHGTHVAGTVGAVGNNATGVTGVAWQVQLMPVRFLGTNGGFLSDAIEGITYAQNNGATILNNSWGGAGFSTALRNAIAALEADDILFVAAAGNDGVNADITPGYPAAYDLPHIVSVAASDRNDQRASFSNFGAESVDLAAPGVSIRSTFNSGDASYALLNGTSMASPHVAGALAVLRAEFPGEDAASLKARLIDTVDLVDGFLTTTVSGGRLNLEGALLNAVTPRHGVLRFASDSVNAVENSGSVPVIVRRVGGSDGAVSVSYRTVAASAVAGEDFTAIDGAVLSWGDGDAADRTISLALLDDALTEGTERFDLELFAPSGDAAVGTPGSLRVNLIDDEAAPLDGFEFTGASNVAANFALAEPAPAVVSMPDGGFVLAEIQFTGVGVELLLRRHAADGTMLWQRNHIAGGGVFQPRVTAGADGRIFVGYSRLTLNSSGQITEADLAALAYSSAGVLLWDVALPNPSGAIDLVNTVSLGEDGGLYLGGEYALVAANDAVLARLDAVDGGFSWQRVFKPNPDFDGDDAVSALAPAPGGGIWAGGWTVGTTGFEGVLRRYDASGALSLERRYATQGQQRVLDLAVNAFGEVYLSLRSFDNVTGVFSGKLLRVASATGEVVWERNQAIGSSAANFFIESNPNGLIDYLQAPNSLANGSGLYSVGRYDRSGVKLFENNLDTFPLSVTGMDGADNGGIVFTGAFDGPAQFGEVLIDGGDEVSAYVAQLLPQDPVSPGVPTFDTGPLAVSEGIGELSVVVRRVGGADGTVRVGLRTIDGTAIGGEDFLALDQVLEFQPGELSQQAQLTIIDDFELEPDETLQLELYDLGGGTLPTENALVTVRLLNDDFAFEQWLGDFFEPGAPDAVENADPDGDGQSNLIEYAFGLDPLQPDVLPPQVAALQAGGVIRFTYQRHSERDDLRFQALISQDLVKWTAPSVISESMQALSDTMEAVTLEVNAPFDPSDKAFLRLEIERSSQGIGAK